MACRIPRKDAGDFPPAPRYRLLYRPASFSTLPSGLRWNFVEVPSYYAANRPDLPVSRHTHGVIETDRQLTEEELRFYEIESDLPPSFHGDNP